MSMSPENYEVIRKKYNELIGKIESYFSRYGKDAEYTEPLIFFEEIESLTAEINKRIGQIELGVDNLKANDTPQKYTEMLRNLNFWREKLREFRD